MRKILYLIPFFFFLISCSSTQRSVVVYTSVDQEIAEPVLRAIGDRTGLHVLAVYDVEAAKTTGLVNRLIAEKNRPQADVFWNSEFAQTIMLKEKNVLQQYKARVPENLLNTTSDSDGFWTSFGGRARVFLINTNRVQEGSYPTGMDDFLSAKFTGNDIAMAYPQFGTSATHAGVLYALMGQQQAKDWYSVLVKRGVRIVDGNSVVRDLVAQGGLAWGITDTDDACSALEKKAPVKAIFPDQGERGIGTLEIPNTVAMIAGGPHPTEARIFMDELVGVQTQQHLADLGWTSIPLPGINVPCFAGETIKTLQISLDAVYQNLDQAKKDLAEIIVR